jgi:hypothetical protein
VGRTGALLGCVLAAACSDQATESLLAPQVASLPTTSEVDPERAALDQLTRAVALALQDKGLRQQVKNDMRESRFTTEHKLEFRGYLAGPRGGMLLAKMARESGLSREQLTALLQAVRPLEFYMPAPEHREHWTGGDNLYVASLLTDHTVPTAFTLAGVPVTLDAEIPASTPVLAIVPAETRFERTLDAGWTNVRDRRGQAIGTLAPVTASFSANTATTCPIDSPDPCNEEPEDPCLYDPSLPECTYTPPPAPTYPAGLYMTYNRVYSDYEGAFSGEPEFEMHVHGASDSSLYGNDLACSGESSGDPYRRYNQDNLTYNGNVLLFTQAQIDANRNLTSEGFNVMMWEDDDTRCTLKYDKDNLRNALLFSRDVLGAAAVALTSTQNPILVAAQFVAAVYNSSALLKSNDEWVGAAVVDTNYNSYNGIYPTDEAGVTHYLVRGGQNHGKLNLILRGM